ncbi:phosphatidylglycerophosphatase B [Photobacterium aphoticum]|uniref:undecaprenyl-diphosphate phosphatase n=2 Tax=Photobacterium aphoticum TaxID=754436 RepID=A0A0J1GL26_9GAMM|nr:phosphatase PAP2 family protein [Photobacterium aphoticum]KLV00465.1 phospholipid phosphatase [Photobacterium aphoticum]PSU59812.1 phosphatase PAP2 family protein [Photobacterium aphoticum]GHA42123.1 phosphatidylglycerophosphatase B [Photobacterium aphoticum]
MTLRSFFAKKIPGLIALLLFGTLLSGVLMFYSQANLAAPASDVAGQFFSALTFSAGKPGFLITVSVLMAIPLLLKVPRQQFLKLGVQFAILLVLSFAAKSGLKHLTEVPRPYTYELEALGIVSSPEDFYQLDEKGKDHAVMEARQHVSEWRIQHWLGETNYSLPSGHTIFVAVCVVFWGGFFLRRRHYVPAAALIVWATGVGVSRIWLGMHWPTDLLASVGCAALLYLCVPEWQSES